MLSIILTIILAVAGSTVGNYGDAELNGSDTQTENAGPPNPRQHSE